MFDIVLIVLAVIAVVIAAILVIAATTQPDTFSVQRSTSIAAAPDAICPLINDLHAHRSWSPFDKDPGIQRSYSGAPKGPGSAMDFADRKAGTGRVEITEASPPLQVMMRL